MQEGDSREKVLAILSTQLCSKKLKFPNFFRSWKPKLRIKVRGVRSCCLTVEKRGSIGRHRCVDLARETKTKLRVFRGQVEAWVGNSSVSNWGGKTRRRGESYVFSLLVCCWLMKRNTNNCGGKKRMRNEWMIKISIRFVNTVRFQTIEWHSKVLVEQPPK